MNYALFIMEKHKALRQSDDILTAGGWKIKSKIKS